MSILLNKKVTLIKKFSNSYGRIHQSIIFDIFLGNFYRSWSHTCNKFDRGITDADTWRRQRKSPPAQNALDMLPSIRSTTALRTWMRVRARVRARVKRGWRTGIQGEGSIVFCRTHCTMQYTRLELPDRIPPYYSLSLSLSIYLSIYLSISISLLSFLPRLSVSPFMDTAIWERWHRLSPILIEWPFSRWRALGDERI